MISLTYHHDFMNYYKSCDKSLKGELHAPDNVLNSMTDNQSRKPPAIRNRTNQSERSIGRVLAFLSIG